MGVNRRQAGIMISLFPRPRSLPERIVIPVKVVGSPPIKRCHMALLHRDLRADDLVIRNLNEVTGAGFHILHFGLERQRHAVEF